MDFNRLRCFVVLAEELNFRRAADRLHVSQPHLTRLIAQLEKELGVKLLHRTTRQVNLTASGEALCIQARDILARTEQAVRTVRRVADGETGRLGLAFTEIALHSIVPGIVAKFRDRFPKIQLDIVEACTEDQVEALRIAKVDVGLLHPPLAVDFLEVLPIHQERLRIALPVTHPLAARSSVALAELANDRFILHPREHGAVLYDQIFHLCEQAEFSPKVVHKAAEQTFIGLVAAGVGVCFVPPSVPNLQNLGIVFLPIAGCAPTLEFAVAWRQDDTSPSVEAFLSVVHQITAKARSPSIYSAELSTTSTCSLA